MKQKILDDLIDVRYATPYNLYSPTANTCLGSVLTARKDLIAMEKTGLVAKVDNDIPVRHLLREQFYKLTKKGAADSARQRPRGLSEARVNQVHYVKRGIAGQTCED